jgi:hypothetical protein
VNQPVHKKELRNFGLLVGGVFVVISLWPLLLRNEPVRAWAAVAGGSLIVLGGVSPLLLAPIHQGWMWIGHILGWVNTRILLGIVFYGLLTPIGLVLRLMGKNSMRPGFEGQSSTYRIVRQPRPRSHMNYQF